MTWWRGRVTAGCILFRRGRLSPPHCAHHTALARAALPARSALQGKHSECRSCGPGDPAALLGQIGRAAHQNPVPSRRAAQQQGQLSAEGPGCYTGGDLLLAYLADWHLGTVVLFLDIVCRLKREIVSFAAAGSGSTAKLITSVMTRPLVSECHIKEGSNYSPNPRIQPAGLRLSHRTNFKSSSQIW